MAKRRYCACEEKHTSTSEEEDRRSTKSSRQCKRRNQRTELHREEKRPPRRDLAQKETAWEGRGSYLDKGRTCPTRKKIERLSPSVGPSERRREGQKKGGKKTTQAPTAGDKKIQNTKGKKQTKTEKGHGLRRRILTIRNQFEL